MALQREHAGRPHHRLAGRLDQATPLTPMTTPKFSVLIPTRDRPATLRHTLATVLSQPGDDYEVIVADNYGTPETRQLIDENARPNLRYTRSEEILPMAENWERGLELCEG